MIVKLTPDGCRKRQKRLFGLLEEQKLDSALITDPRDVYYFSGALSEIPYPRALLLSPQAVRLVSEKEYPEAAVDTQSTYPLQTMATLNFQLNQNLVGELRRHLSRAGRVGVQFESLSFSLGAAVVEEAGAELVALDDHLLQMQSVKDPDELQVLRRSNQLNDIGYAAVREAIRPGVTEAEVLGTGKQAVTSAAGCDCFYSGDFRCAAPGGFATDRVCREGELYIVDAWVNYQGYWSDNCRTFPVTRLNDVQRRAWAMTEETVLKAEEMVRPGVSCRKVFRLMQQMQDRIKPGSFLHHGGHGTGLRSHEYPRINPHFNDFFKEGNVITIEPGVYGEELRGGIRLECNYLVLENGVERLNQFPISMTTRGTEDL